MKNQDVTQARKVIYFSLISLLLLAFFSFQSCQEATAPENIETNHILQKTTNTKLSIDDYEDLIRKTAYGMAKFLKSEHNRKLLNKELNESKYVEQIIEASQFLNKFENIEVNNKISEKTFLQGISNNVNGKENFISKITNLSFGMIDIYFPLEKWRKEWNGNDNLLVAFVGYRRNDDKSDILAYDLDGNEVYLPPNEIPNTPTLVIYPSEKRGNYTKDNTDKNYYQTLQKSNSIASTNTEGEPEPQTEFRCTGLYIEKDYDSGFWGGDMEIMFKVWKRPVGGSWSSSFFVYIDPDVVSGEEGGVWKAEDKKIYEYTGTSHEMAFQVLEDDGWFNGWYDLIHDTEWSQLRNIGGALLNTNIVRVFPLVMYMIPLQMML